MGSGIGEDEEGDVLESETGESGDSSPEIDAKDGQSEKKRVDGESGRHIYILMRNG